MHCLQKFIVASALILISHAAIAERSSEKASTGKTALPKEFANWNGRWVISERANALLGFKSGEPRDGVGIDSPIRFELKLDSRLGQSTDAKTLSIVDGFLADKMGHTILATGTWDTTFEVEPGIDKICFVSRHNGSTFLWTMAPYIVFYGGEVTVVEGADKSKDILLIDFDVTTKHLAGAHRSVDTVAYSRVKPKTEQKTID